MYVGAIDAIRDLVHGVAFVPGQPLELHTDSLLVVEGWVADPEAHRLPANVYGVIDAGDMFRALFGYPRSDIGELLGGECRNAGFRLYLDPRSFAPGLRRLAILAAEDDGKRLQACSVDIVLAKIKAVPYAKTPSGTVGAHPSLERQSLRVKDAMIAALQERALALLERSAALEMALDNGLRERGEALARANEKVERANEEIERLKGQLAFRFDIWLARNAARVKRRLFGAK